MCIVTSYAHQRHRAIRDGWGGGGGGGAPKDGGPYENIKDITHYMQIGKGLGPFGRRLQCYHTKLTLGDFL